MGACPDYPFFALQDGGYCSCDHTFGTPKETYPKIRDQDCDVKGNGLGGPWANAVYSNDLYVPDPDDVDEDVVVVDDGGDHVVVIDDDGDVVVVDDSGDVVVIDDGGDLTVVDDGAGGEVVIDD